MNPYYGKWYNKDYKYIPQSRKWKNPPGVNECWISESYLLDLHERDVQRMQELNELVFREYRTTDEEKALAESHGYYVINGKHPGQCYFTKDNRVVSKVDNGNGALWVLAIYKKTKIGKQRGFRKLTNALVSVI